MNIDEKRKFNRVKICYPLSYSCIDRSDKIIHENSGNALDISQGGLRLGTTNIISTDKICLSANNYKGNKIEIKGKVMWCKKVAMGEYQAGVRFEGRHEFNIRFAIEIVRAHHYLKDEQNFNEDNYQSASAA